MNLPLTPENFIDIMHQQPDKTWVNYAGSEELGVYCAWNYVREKVEKELETEWLDLSKWFPFGYDCCEIFELNDNSETHQEAIEKIETYFNNGPYKVEEDYE